MILLLLFTNLKWKVCYLLYFYTMVNLWAYFYYWTNFMASILQINDNLYYIFLIKTDFIDNIMY